MDELKLFTDGSVNPQAHIGYGAHLVVSEGGLTLDELYLRVKVRRFEQTSSTKLELQTLVWALGNIQGAAGKVIIYTDSQNIVGLPGRRDRLEQRAFQSKKHTHLKNYELYQEFYRLTDRLDCEFIKVCGHQQSTQKNEIGQLFTLVDRASRAALRSGLFSDAIPGQGPL